MKHFRGLRMHMYRLCVLEVWSFTWASTYTKKWGGGQNPKIIASRNLGFLNLQKTSEVQIWGLNFFYLSCNLQY